MSAAVAKRGAPLKPVEEDEEMKELERLLATLTPEQLQALELELIDPDVSRLTN